MLTYLAIADRLRPRWIVWENVPGVLSSDGGRDFGTFLGALGEVGYGWAYRVLDAQWCRTHGHPRAVPQRRRRVFVVGCLGDNGSAAAVLFERESVFRDTSTRRKAGQDLAESVASSVDTVGAICAGTVGETLQDACTGRMIPTPAPVVIDRAAFNQGPGAMYPPRIEESEIMSALVARGPHAVATATNPNQEVATTLSARDYKGPSCGRDGVTGNPIVCTTYAVAHTLTAGARRGVTEDGTGRGVPLVVAQAVPFYDPSPTLTAKMQGSSGWAPYNETAHLVGVPAVAHALTKRHDSSEDGTGRGVPLVVARAQPIAFDVYNSKLTGDVIGVVREQHGTNTNAVLIPQPVTFQENGFGTITLNEIANPLTCGGGKPGQGYVAALIHNAAPTVTTIGLRFATTETEDVSQTLITERACGSCVAFQEEVKPVGVDLYNNTTTGDVHVPLRTAGGHGAPACLVPSPYVVRRLTPTECERLQGFPDDWTAVPFRGKPAADGPRYKALGNSMAVNCMEWIGQRIAAYEAEKSA